ncbi:major capsid protein [Mycobacterium phage Estes]|uniref:Major capsid protein n=1 Tax=Mycobacterium phage Estes TaxID=2759459 RepID=A0A7G9A293_9CAUD|nr:major head protein [Mycobacterium phage Estes]QNL30732.1 major capsid protein [Mycobacterium phage Estes]
MANAFIKPPVIIASILGQLKHELVLPNYVFKNGYGDVAHKFNDTITIRIPVPTIAHTRGLRATGAARNMVASDLTEVTVDIKLTDVIYNRIDLTDEERELDVRSFAVDVLPRQVRAVAEQIEDAVSYLITKAPYEKVSQVAEDGIWNGVISNRRFLNEQKVPKDGRVLLVGSAVEEALLLDDRFVRYDSAGEAGASRLQTARIGRLAQYDVVTIDTLPHGDAYLSHPTAYAMLTRSPGRPMTNTVATSTVATENGVQLRWLGDYDATATTERSIVDTWIGVKAVLDPVTANLDDEPRFVRGTRLHLKATSAELTGPATLAGAGATAQLELEDNNGDNRAGDPLVTWSSSDDTKVKVDANGKISRIAAGTATITALVDGLTKTLAVTAS